MPRKDPNAVPATATQGHTEFWVDVEVCWELNTKNNNREIDVSTAFSEWSLRLAINNKLAKWQSSPQWINGYLHAFACLGDRVNITPESKLISVEKTSAKFGNLLSICKSYSPYVCDDDLHVCSDGESVHTINTEKHFGRIRSVTNISAVLESALSTWLFQFSGIDSHEFKPFGFEIPRNVDSSYFIVQSARYRNELAETLTECILEVVDCGSSFSLTNSYGVTFLFCSSKCDWLLVLRW